MRENKYRSYNSYLKKFFYFSNGRYYDDAGKCISERVCREFNWSNAEQYTGMKDKNGVEIYGGDRLRNKYNTYVVFWNKESASFKLNNNHGHTHSFNSFMDTLEIFSNIHEDTK